MKAVAVVANILLPGVGSFVVGKVGAGIAQFLIWGLGLLLTIGTLGVGGIIGLPMMIVAWIWALVSAVSGPVEVTIVQRGGN